MTADKRADILSLARKTIHTEALALKHLEQTLGDDFVCAVELILHSRGKLVVTGMGKSGLIGRKIAATLASTGTPSFFLHRHRHARRSGGRRGIFETNEAIESWIKNLSL